MNSTTTRRPRPELDLVDGCACGPRCRLTGDCLETGLADERFGVWTRDERTTLRMAS